MVNPLFEDEVVVLLAPDHALAQRPHVRPGDLANETLILYPPKEESRVLQQVLLPAGISPHVQEVALTEAIFELVKAGPVSPRWHNGPPGRSSNPERWPRAD